MILVRFSLLTSLNDVVHYGIGRHCDRFVDTLVKPTSPPLIEGDVTLVCVVDDADGRHAVVVVGQRGHHGALRLLNLNADAAVLKM